MDLIARKKLNLEVLKRHDANICDILDQSAHAVVYKFDTDKASWEKLGYEGVIFLTQGKSAPWFGLYVLNRLSIENFSLHLTDFEEINLTDEFIIYQTSEGEACALWLFEKKDRERILAKIQKLHEGMKALPSAMKPKVQPQAQQQQSVETKGMDLLQMLKSGTVQQQQQAPQQQPPTESKLDLLQMLKQASTNNNTPPPTSNKSPLDTVGNDLLSVLGGGSAQQQTMPTSIPSHDNEKVYSGTSTDNQNRPGNNNRLQELFDITNNNNNNGPQAVPPHQRRIVANGELTKPFYPPNFANNNGNSPAHSPLTQNRNPGALLQALHGGLIQPPLPPPPPPHYLMNPHPPQLGGLLPPQQVLGLMRPEVARRFPNGGRPTLSKPEFIQQLLNMIQCDPTFFDILYENYQQQQGPPMGPNSNMPVPHPAPPLAPPSATFPTQQQQQQQ